MEYELAVKCAKKELEGTKFNPDSFKFNKLVEHYMGLPKPPKEIKL